MDDVNLPLIAGLIAVALIVPAVAAVLWRQYSHWKRAEVARDRAIQTQVMFASALDTAPEGYVVWFYQGAGEPQDRAPTEQC